MEKKLKVLIADNSSQFAKACQNELETQGYDVSCDRERRSQSS